MNSSFRIATAKTLHQNQIMAYIYIKPTASVDFPPSSLFLPHPQPLSDSVATTFPNQFTELCPLPILVQTFLISFLLSACKILAEQSQPLSGEWTTCSPHSSPTWLLAQHIMCLPLVCLSLFISLSNKEVP